MAKKVSIKKRKPTSSAKKKAKTKKARVVKRLIDPVEIRKDDEGVTLPPTLDDLKKWCLMKGKELKEECVARGFIQSGTRRALVSRLFANKRKITPEEELEISTQYFGKNIGLSQYFLDAAEEAQGFKQGFLKNVATTFDIYPEAFDNADDACSLPGFGDGTKRRIKTYFEELSNNEMNGGNNKPPPLEVRGESDKSEAQTQVLNTIKDLFSKVDEVEEDGIHVNDIVKTVGYPLDVVKQCIEALINDGNIYQTIDEDHIQIIS